MKSSALKDNQGFSLIELLIILVIVGILTTFAVISFRGATTDFERQRIVREFKIYLERARFDSVKRRADTAASMARVTLNGQTSFTASIDFDNNGILDLANETRVVNFSTRSNTRIELSDATLDYPVTLRFNQRGHIISRDASGNDVDPLFTICSNCSAASPDETVISVSTTGTVAILRDGQLPSTLPAPNTTTQSPTLNCYVAVVNAGCPLN